ERVRADAARASAGTVALIQRRTDYRVGSRASAALTGVGLSAGVAVVTRRAIRLRRMRADAAGAGSCAVTLVERRADDGGGPRAGAGLAGVGLCAGVAVVARSAVGLRRIRADAAGTGSCGMTLVEGCADDGVGSRADSGLARIGLSAGVAVVARSAVCLEGIGA